LGLGNELLWLQDLVRECSELEVEKIRDLRIFEPGRLGERGPDARQVGNKCFGEVLQGCVAYVVANNKEEE
jgi:hypothetical protein